MKTDKVPKKISKENWKEEHLNYMHSGVYYTWCPLCMAKEKGEENKVKNNDLGVEVSDLIKPKSLFGK